MQLIQRYKFIILFYFDDIQKQFTQYIRKENSDKALFDKNMEWFVVIVLQWWYRLLLFCYNGKKLYEFSRRNGKSSRTLCRCVTGVSDSDILTSYYIIYGISRPYVITSESDFWCDPKLKMLYSENGFIIMDNNGYL